MLLSLVLLLYRISSCRFIIVSKCHVLAISRGFLASCFSSLQDPLLTTLNLSINDYSRLNNALVGIDIVIHLASSSLPQTSNDNPISDVNSNLIGSLNILQLVLTTKLKGSSLFLLGGTVMVVLNLCQSVRHILPIQFALMES